MGCKGLTQAISVYQRTSICFKLADKKFSEHEILKIKIRNIASKYFHEVKPLSVKLLVTADNTINNEADAKTR
jgi:hypothetical protein